MPRALSAAFLCLVLLLDPTLSARPPPRRIPNRPRTASTRKPSANKQTPAKFSLPAFFKPAAPPPPPPFRIKLDEAVATAKNAVTAIKPVQVLSGFMLAVALGGGTIVATTNAVTGFLSEDGNGEVLERTLKFGTILENVKAAYVDRNVDLDKLFETGVNSMLSVLDPYSTFENTEQSEDLALRTSGRYGGVGLTIGKDDKDQVLVLGALEGFAFDAGVRPGDRIVAIDGKKVEKLSVDAVKTLLRGEPGTSIMLTVQRDGSTEPELSMPVSRKLVRLPDVTLASMDRDGVGYIKLEGFSEGTAEETARAIRRLQADGTHLKALVLDLRDNPGGLLDAAVAVSQQLVPEGTEIVSTSGRVYGEGTSLSYRSTKPPLLNPRTKLVVLVNSNTASAAEIVTGVVQDTDRGVVVGERTFGKGLVQIVEPLPGGGALKLTVAKYYTPSGRCIQAVTYGGGRMEASAAKALAKDGVSTPAGGVGDGVTPIIEDENGPLSPIAPAPTSSTSPENKKEGGDSKASGAGEEKNKAGAVRRIDPSEPSLPSASKDDEEYVYVTEHGRKVKAGGGIGPDVLVDARKLGELERSLLQKGLFFDFAGDWLQRHAGSMEQLATSVDTKQDEAYREFETFVRNRASQKEGLFEPAGISRQLDALQKSITASGGEKRTRSLNELALLRKKLQAEQLDEFRTQKSAIKEDVVEALLGRLTSPSVRLAAQLGTDPQVNFALSIAKDDAKYNEYLAPDVDDEATEIEGRKIVRYKPPPPIEGLTKLVFPQDELAIDERPLEEYL